MLKAKKRLDKSRNLETILIICLCCKCTGNKYPYLKITQKCYGLFARIFLVFNLDFVLPRGRAFILISDNGSLMHNVCKCNV